MKKILYTGLFLSPLFSGAPAVGLIDYNPIAEAGMASKLPDPTPQNLLDFADEGCYNRSGLACDVALEYTRHPRQKFYDLTKAQDYAKKSMEYGGLLGYEYFGDAAMNAGDFDQAFRFYRIGCFTKNVRSTCTRLGTLYVNSGADMDLGKKILEMTCKSGDKIACERIGGLK